MGYFFYFYRDVLAVFSKGAVLVFCFACSKCYFNFYFKFDTNIRKAIAFNISGPVCLGLASLYTFRRKMTLEQIMTLLSMGLPIVSLWFI
jgi:hypothetical protein